MELAQAHPCSAHAPSSLRHHPRSRGPEASCIIIDRFTEQGVLLHPGTRVERVERAIRASPHIGKRGETEVIKEAICRRHRTQAQRQRPEPGRAGTLRRPRHQGEPAAQDASTVYAMAT
jgi:hypothetical protein